MGSAGGLLVITTDPLLENLWASVLEPSPNEVHLAPNAKFSPRKVFYSLLWKFRLLAAEKTAAKKREGKKQTGNADADLVDLVLVHVVVILLVFTLPSDVHRVLTSPPPWP